jgi:hypothetical protein
MVCAWWVVSGAPKKMTRMKTAGTVRVIVRMSERKAGYVNRQSLLVRGHVVFQRHTTALAPKSWVGFDCFFHFCLGGGGAWPVDGRQRKQ